MTRKIQLRSRFAKRAFQAEVVLKKECYFKSVDWIPTCFCSVSLVGILALLHNDQQ